MTEIDKLAWLCIQDKKVLGARSKNKNACYLPGGKREKGESDQAALIREIKEELSVDLLPNTVQYLHTFKGQAHGQPKGVLVKLTCYLAEFTGTIQANAEIAEVMWLNYQDKPKCSATMQMVMDWLKLKEMIK